MTNIIDVILMRSMYKINRRGRGAGKSFSRNIPTRKFRNCHVLLKAIESVAV